MPIGDPSDISLNFLQHISVADIILVERIKPLIKVMQDSLHLYCESGYDISSKATIYQYQVENYLEESIAINKILLNEAKNGKKIFIVSDEGNPLFLEPMVSFKDLLRENEINYKVLPGPNSVISAITSGPFNALDFCFGGNYEWISESRKKIIFDSVKKSHIPVVFILRAIGLVEFISELSNTFNEDWVADLGINLTMATEHHINGTLTEILENIRNKPEYWEKEESNKKFIISIFPLNYKKYLGNVD